MLGEYGGYSRPPRRVTTAYMFYVRASHRAFVEQHSNDVIKTPTTKIVSETAKSWRDLEDEDKQPFKLMEQLDRERYKADKKNWAMRFDGGKAPKKKRLTKLEPGAPLRTRNAFVFFQQVQWNQLPQGKTNKENVQELARQWRALPAEEREIYVEQSLQDKKRYQLEMKDFRLGMVWRQAQKLDEFMRLCDLKDNDDRMRAAAGIPAVAERISEV